MLVINLLGQRDFLLYYCTMSRIAVVGKFDPGATIFLTYPRQLGVRSRCRRFLNQLETWVRVSPVFLAKAFFSSGVGYRLSLYVSFKELRDFSLKQYTVSSPSQMVRGSGYFRRSRYLSTAPGKYFRIKIFDRNKNILWGFGVRRQWVVTCLRQQIQLTFTINAINVLAEEPTSGSVVIYLYTCLGSGLSEVEMKILPRYFSRY